MGRKKIDKKICHLIKNCSSSNQRALFLIMGQKAKEQIVILHHILQKSRNEFKLEKPSILWCFKKDCGFTYILNKTQKILKKKYSSNYSLSIEDCLDHFFAAAEIKFCHYSDTTSVLGQTFGILVIQDFEAVTPNILARVIECVEGGGMVIFLLPNNQILQDISSMKMDAHSKYVTVEHQTVHPLFNHRFVLSLSDCKTCVVLDDKLKIQFLHPDFDSFSFPIKATKFHVKNTENNPLGKISTLCCTKDQTEALKLFVDQLKNKFSNIVLSLTSARGRGKSATLGLAIASAIFLKFSSIYITSPQIDNVQTLFSFILKGLNALGFEDRKGYNITYSSSENYKFISGINLFGDHKQVIKYLNPTEFCKAEIADIVVIDEAAAIPLPVVKNWLNSNKVFMASTINGYEGTGRSLSMKLLFPLRVQSASPETDFTLHEVVLNEPIRYAVGDKVESWLNSLFCLDSEVTVFNETFPASKSCQLYYINKDVLFSYHDVAEKFLQQLISLFVSSHYKNCPNDLLLMADAPSHHLFCLLPPVDVHSESLPDVLCVVQVALEGKIPKDSIIHDLSHGKRASGDLIPWIISQQFQNNDFSMLFGARIVRITTHPSYQKMGYGQQALNLLFSYYRGDIEKDVDPSEVHKSTLLLKLTEIPHQKLDYVGVSYGLTYELLKFWKKLEFVPLYLRQTASEVTGEHSCIMIRSLQEATNVLLSEFSQDFLRRFLSLLSSAFQKLPSLTALEILRSMKNTVPNTKDSCPLLDSQQIFSPCSIKRLRAYSNHLVDYHLIMDLMPILARYYFMNYFKEFFLSSIQEAVLLSMGLQNKSVEETALNLDMEVNQIMALFMKSVKKILHHLSPSQQNFSQLKNENASYLYNSDTPKDHSLHSKSSKRQQENKEANKLKKMKNEENGY